MELPVRISGLVPSEPVISVDGSWGAPGLELSHWPGNRTPRELARDLSTEIALAFARLPAARRRELAGGAVAIVNNHYDTDGVCALFAVRHPRAALELERELVDAARAGDLFQVPSERAFCVDQIVAAMADVERSPIAEQLRGLEGDAKHEVAAHAILERMPELLRGELAAYEGLFERELDELQADLAALASTRRDELVHLDWSTWSAPASAFPEGRNPGRHALFGSTDRDRVLVALPGADGTRYRFVVNTTSWFELVTRTALARPDLRALAGRLNELEGSDPNANEAWRWQDPRTPSPELWFGACSDELFPERLEALRPSRLSIDVVRREVARALRDTLELPI